jgi:hypothetical protein
MGIVPIGGLNTNSSSDVILAARAGLGVATKCIIRVTYKSEQTQNGSQNCEPFHFGYGAVLQVFDLRHADGVEPTVNADDLACGVGPTI